jgi:hypothetical protein
MAIQVDSCAARDSVAGIDVTARIAYAKGRAASEIEVPPPGFLSKKRRGEQSKQEYCFHAALTPGWQWRIYF